MKVIIFLLQSLPAVGSSPTVSWNACRSTQGKFIELNAALHIISGEICLISIFWHFQRPAQLHNHHPKPTFCLIPVNQTPYGLLPTLENLSRDQRFPSQTRLSKAHLHHHLRNGTAGPSLFQKTCLGAVPTGILVHPRFGPQSNVAVKVEEHLVQALEPALCHFVVPVPPSPVHPYTHLLALPSLA